jgi:NAD(P)-dependent dehydrogenase (short-subunit alcohol dehydrogenase family)
VAREISARGVRGAGYALDVLDFDAVPRMQDRVVAEFGSLDIWVNNAGGNLDRKMYGLPEISLAKWQEQINLNLTSKFWGAQQAARRMPDGGRIISIISVAAHHASPGFGAYSAANNAVISMTRTMAVELAPRGITVNCIAPGIIVTDMFVETLNMTWEDAERYAAQETPLGRTGYPEDVAAAAVFLASPAAEWTTGQFIDVAGGR